MRAIDYVSVNARVLSKIITIFCSVHIFSTLLFFSEMFTCRCYVMLYN